MCEVLVTADGIELSTLDEARRYGIGIPADAGGRFHGDDWCLCSLDLEAVLDAHPSVWKAGFTMSGDGWSEVGPDGRTWDEGFDIRTEDPKYPGMINIRRSDGRKDLTLNDWEAARSGADHV